MRRVGWMIGLLVLTCAPAMAARQRVSMWCEQGGQTVTVNGIVSSTKVQRSYVSGTTGCSVDVFDAGTTNHTAICSDAACSTPITQPFIATSTGYITFFVQTEPATVDVRMSGAGIASPFTIAGIQVCGLTTCTGGGGGSGTVTTVTRTNNAGPVATLTITNPATTPNIDITTGLTFSGLATKVATAGASFVGTNAPVCRDANGDLYTTSCPSPANALIFNPSVTQTAQGLAPTVVSLQSECPSGAASTLDCFAIQDNTGTNVFESRQDGVSVNKDYIQSLGYRNALVNVSFSTTPTFNLTLGHTFAITLTANVTSSTLFGTVPANYSQPVTFIITQDGTGGHTFVWPTNVLSAPVVTGTASSVTVATLYFDGTNFRNISADSGPSTGLAVTTSGTPAPAPLATATCPTGEAVWMYGLNGSGNYQTLASWDTAGSPPTPTGQISWCRPFVYNDSGTSIHPNRAVTLFHYGGNGGLTNDTAHDDTTLFSSFQNAGAGQNFHQAGAYYGETILTGNPTFGAHAGGERSAFGMRLNLTDLRTNAVTLSGNGFAVYSGQFEKQTTSAEPSKHGVFDGTFSNEAGGNQGNQNSFVYRAFCENVSGSPTNYSCSAFEITAPTPAFPTQNIGLLVNGTWPTGSLDFPIEVSGDSTHGHVYLGGPTKIGGALAHAAASTILELGGATGSWAGFAHIRMDGSTSGACTISVDATSTTQTNSCTTSASTFTSTVATGTPPFTVGSTTNVPNLNASSLNGATFAAPGAIGGTTPAAGTFTTLIANTSLTINSGTPILKVLSATATLDFGSLVSIGCEDLTITVTGAALGDTVSLGVPNGSVPSATFTYSGWVSAADTVTIRGCALVSGDPASGTFRATVVKF